MLILSLLAWEHLLGFVGLFASFPFLYVAGKVLQEFAEEDSPAPEALAPSVVEGPVASDAPAAQVAL